MSENGNGHIQLLGHKSARPTKAEVEKQLAADIERIATQAAVKVTEFYMHQFPGLVASMLAEAFAAHGLTLKEPPQVAPDVTPVTDTALEPQ